MKKYLLGLFAIVIAVAGSAFTTKAKNHPTSVKVFYNNSTTDITSVRTNYVYDDPGLLFPPICTSNLNRDCKADWEVGTQSPAIGDNPQVGSTIGTKTSGTYVAGHN